MSSHENRILALATCSTALIMLPSLTQAADLAAKPAPKVELSKLALSFEPNQGQLGSKAVRFLAHGPSCSIALTDSEAVLTLKPGSARDVVRLRVVGEQRGIRAVASTPQSGRVNYLIGSDRGGWLTDVPTYGKVGYAGVYPGIDLVYYGNQGRLEYDFVVAAGASATPIALRFAGSRKVELDREGNLRVSASGGRLVFERPVAYQVDEGQRREVAARYRLDGQTVRFALGDYDRKKPLIIDPVLSYLSYLGGGSGDVGSGTQIGQNTQNSTTGSAAGIDQAGNLYVAGYTTAMDFPSKNPVATPTAKSGGSGQPWAFVSKLSPDGSSLVYSTYLGGSVYDEAFALAVDSSGSAYVTGQTNSNDFPVTSGAYQKLCGPTNNGPGGSDQANCGNGASNAFILKLNPAGNALVYSTFLGGANTIGSAIAVDGAGRAYVAGLSANGGCADPSPNPRYKCFPTTAGAVLAASGSYGLNSDGNYGSGGANTNAFLSVFDPTGATLVYSTLFGEPNNVGTGNAITYGFAVAVDPAGTFYLGGVTGSALLPTTPGAFQATSVASTLYPAALGQSDGGALSARGFVAKFSPVTSSTAPALVYATYLGGHLGIYDAVSGLAADASGSVYATGTTGASDFPVTAGAYQTVCAKNGGGTCSAAFVAKLTPDGTALAWSTYFGGLTGSGDAVYHEGPIALDSNGNVYVAGTAGSNLPQVKALPNNNVGAQAFVAEFDPTGKTLLFSSLLGGASEEAGLAIDKQGAIYVAGTTSQSGGLAVTTGAFQTAYSGGSSNDGFVGKILPGGSSTTGVDAGPSGDAGGAGDEVGTADASAKGGAVDASEAGARASADAEMDAGVQADAGPVSQPDANEADAGGARSGAPGSSGCSCTTGTSSETVPHGSGLVFFLVALAIGLRRWRASK